jgi:hypothetical protein
MSESQSHKKAKTAGLNNPKTEVSIKGNRRLDAKDDSKAREVERSGNPEMIKKAIKRLNSQSNLHKELLVPNKDLDMAKEVAENTIEGKLTIQNLGRTKRRFV